MTRRGAVGAVALVAAGALLVDALGARPQASPASGEAVAVLAPAVADAFLEHARAGTARYADPAVASREGFRRVGVEFPAMGEHWVNLARVMADTFDAASPSVLAYARVRGKLTLVGVGYTDIMAASEQPPAFEHRHWHEHNGSIAEESLARSTMQAAPGSAGLRVAILHAWAWLPNPDGPFITDNPALPYARHGLARPADDEPRLRAALSLAAGTVDYYELASRADEPHPSGDAAAVRALLSRYAAAAATEVAGTGGSLGVHERAALLSRWDALWRDLAIAVPERGGVSARLRAAGEVHAHH